MALWPFEQLIEVINGRRALRTTLSGSKVVEMVPVTTEPLAAGATFTQPFVDIAANQVAGTGLLVSSDQPVTVELVTRGPGNTSPAAPTEVTLRTGTAYLFVPPVRPLGVSYAWRLTNNSGSAMSVLSVIEMRYYFMPAGVQNLRATLAYNKQIRDTQIHSGVANSGGMYRLRRTLFGGGKVPIFVQNTHDQALTITVNLTISNAMTASLGAIDVPAASNRVITNQDFAGLDVPAEELFISARASVAPTSGQLNAWCDTVVGGTV